MQPRQGGRFSLLLSERYVVIVVEPHAAPNDAIGRSDYTNGVVLTGALESHSGAADRQAIAHRIPRITTKSAIGPEQTSGPL